MFCVPIVQCQQKMFKVNIWLSVIFFFIIACEGLCLTSEKSGLVTVLSTASLHVFTHFRIFCSPCAINCMKADVLAKAQMNYFAYGHCRNIF